MAVSLAAGFKINNNEPIDTRLVLTKAQMKSIQAAGMPAHYFALCSEDNKIYVYDASNTEDETTGKFKLYSGGSSYTPGSGINITDDKISVKIDNESIKLDSDGNLYTKVGTDYQEGQGITFTEEKTGQGEQILISNAYWCNSSTGEEFNQCVLSTGGSKDHGESQTWVADTRAKMYNLKFKFENKFEDMYDFTWFVYKGGQTAPTHTFTKSDILDAKTTFENSGSFVWFTEEQNNSPVTLLDIKDNYFVIKVQISSSSIQTYLGTVTYHKYLEIKKTINANVDNTWITVKDNKVTVADSVSSTINTWKDVVAPPTATDDKQYVYKNNSWVTLPELSDTLTTATNAQGKTEYQSVVSLSLGDDGLLKFNNGKLI